MKIAVIAVLTISGICSLCTATSDDNAPHNDKTAVEALVKQALVNSSCREPVLQITERAIKISSALQLLRILEDVSFGVCKNETELFKEGVLLGILSVAVQWPHWPAREKRDNERWFRDHVNTGRKNVYWNAFQAFIGNPEPLQELPGQLLGAHIGLVAGGLVGKNLATARAGAVVGGYIGGEVGSLLIKING